MLAGFDRAAGAEDSAGGSNGGGGGGMAIQDNITQKGLNTLSAYTLGALLHTSAVCCYCYCSVVLCWVLWSFWLNFRVDF